MYIEHDDKIVKTGIVDILHEDITLPLSLPLYLILPPPLSQTSERNPDDFTAIVTINLVHLELSSTYFRAYSTSHTHAYNKNGFTYAQKDPVIIHTQIFIDLNQAH